MTPEGWTKTTIGHHADVLTGFAFKSAEYTANEQDIKLLRGDNIAPHKLRWRDVKRFPSARAAEVIRYQLQAGDFVVAMDRTWLPSGVKIAEVSEVDLPCLLVQRVARLRAKKSLHQGLMKQFFSGNDFDQYVQAVQTETAVPHISPTDLRDYPISLPPMPEQRRIAEILSTWDRTIETVEALIANARAQKQALMQQLFSAQIRLPGFSEQWTTTTLDQVTKVIVSNVDKKSVASENPVRLCNYMDVYRSDRIEADMDFMTATATTDQTRKFGLRVGDVLITKDSETPEDIAIPAYVASTAPDLVCGYHLAIIRPKKGCDGQFLKYYFEHPHTRYFFATRANGATRFGLTIDAIETAPITLPDYEEQQRIAAVIAAAEQEIDRLKPIAAALREEKSALMQQLLTGKRRVKLNEKEHA